MPTKKRKLIEDERDRVKIQKTNYTISSFFAGASANSSSLTVTPEITAQDKTEANRSCSVNQTPEEAVGSSTTTRCEETQIEPNSISADVSCPVTPDTISKTPKKDPKHRVGFSASWKTKFPWAVMTTVVNDQGENVDALLCSLCSKYKCHGSNGSKTWSVEGYRLLRDDKLLQHQTSEQHKQALSIEINMKVTDMTDDINSEATKSVLDALKVLYVMVKCNTPLDFFTTMIDLCVDVGSPTLANLRLAKNANYSSWDIVHELLGLLSDAVEETVVSEIRSSPCYSTMVDEVADNRSIKHMAICGRYVSREGDIKTAFLTDTELPSATADVITESLERELTSKGLNLADMSGFASDGAAVFLGKKSGVGKRLKDKNPEVITYHCRDHRLALACRDTFKNIPQMKKLDDILENLYKYYKYSCNNAASLKSVQTAFKEAPLAIKQAKHHRWLSHEQAISSILRSYKSIVTDLESSTVSADPVGNGLLKSLKDPFVIKSLLFLGDTLPHVTSLSLFFQRRDVNLGMVKATLDKTLRLLQRRKDHDGPWMLKDSALRDDIGVTETVNAEKFHKDIRAPFIDRLLGNIQARFQDAEVIEHLAIVDLTGTNELPTLYGLTEIEALAEHFKLDTEKLLGQWEDYLQLVSSMETVDRSLTNLVTLMYGEKHQQKGLKEMYPLVAKLLSVAAVLPLSTAEVERIFSQVKLVKTSHRSCLKTSTLTKILNIKMNCTESLFQQVRDKVVSTFYKVKKRRLPQILAKC